MKKFLKNILAILFLICVVFNARASNSEKKDTILFATVNANYRVGLEKLAEEYEKLHPNIKIELTVIAQEFETWIRTRMAAGGDLVPDLYNANYTSGYDRQGKLVALNKYLDSVSPYTGKIWKDSFDPNIIGRYRYAGNHYMMPFDYVEIAVFYNKDIFKKLNLQIPKTWKEWIATCEKIKEAGYVPLAIGGNADSFWAGDMGWLVRLLGDVYLRDLLPKIVTKPEDWDYEPERNEGYQYSPSNYLTDVMVAYSQERMLKAIIDGTFDFSSPKFRQIYIRLKELSQYFQPGYMGIPTSSSLQLFYQQRAAMCILASSYVSGILYDFERMAPEDRFEFGNFWFPEITDDPLACGPFRGVGGGGMTLAVMKKDDPEHEKNVIDFLRFITTPSAAKIIIESTLEDKQPIVGPFLIKGVELPENLSEKFEIFMNRGFEKLNFRGLVDEQESVSEWVVIAQEFMGDRMTMDKFCEEFNEIMVRAANRIVIRDGNDLDPTTKDPIPLASKEKSYWNPFENGSLMLAVILILFISFASFNILCAKGPAKNSTRVAYVLLFPTIILLATFCYFPALSGLYHAFTKWEEGQAAVFNGLDNFRQLIHDEVFYKGIWNMIILLLAGLFKALVVPFVAAELILALVNDKMKRFFRTAFLLPMVVPGLVGILIWGFIYDPNIGMLNQALRVIGLENLTSNWLGNPNLALGSIIFMGFPWIGAFGLLIYMAGLINIPRDVYEAYNMESTNILKRIWHIDIPLVRGQIRMLTILTFIGSVQDFQTVLLMTRGGPGMATYLPALRMYYQAFTYGHFGYGAAIGLVLFIVILLITIINLKVIKPTETM